MTILYLMFFFWGIFSSFVTMKKNSEFAIFGQWVSAGCQNYRRV
jgi:hypothetical protein